MRTKMKIRVDEVTQQHVHLTIFMGEEERTLANCGTLTMSHPEFLLFSVAPMLGEKQMQHHFVTEVDDKKWIEYHDANPTQ